MEIPISEDIRKISSKDIGNFSFKQAAFIAAGCAAAFFTYKMTGSIEIAMIPMGLIIILGFFKPHGMSCFMFAKTVISEYVFSPRTLIYENDFEVDEEFLQMCREDGIVVSEAMYDDIQTDAEPMNIKWSKEDKAKIAF